MNRKNKTTEELSLSELALNRLIEIKNLDKKQGESQFLRIEVSGGGCSGFQYHFDLDAKIKEDDLLIKNGEEVVGVIDEISLEYVKGSVVEFVSELGGSFFKITNPKATSTCGCGSSFAV